MLSLLSLSGIKCLNQSDQHDLILKRIENIKPGFIKYLTHLNNVYHDEGLTLTDVPEEYLTTELCELAILKNPRNLLNLSIKFLTYELYKIAITNDGIMLRCVPYQFRTEEIYRLAIQNYPYVLEYVPDELKTEEMCRIAVTNDGRTLIYVPRRFKTEELYRIALRTFQMKLKIYKNDFVR